MRGRRALRCSVVSSTTRPLCLQQHASCYAAFSAGLPALRSGQCYGQSRCTLFRVNDAPLRLCPGDHRRFLSVSSRLLPSSAGRPTSEAPTLVDEADANDDALSTDLRKLLRHLTNSVVVCTAHSATTSIKVDGQRASLPVGLTMSSFTSLSLCPSPVVSFNIAMPSRTEAAISQARYFTIHILSGDDNGALVADVFRAGNSRPSHTLSMLDASGCRFVWPLPHPPVSSTSGITDSQPYLNGPGILYALRCRLLEEPSRGLIPVQDHVIVLGEVLDIIKGDADSGESTGAPRFGLIYADRRYRQLSLV